MTKFLLFCFLLFTSTLGLTADSSIPIIEKISAPFYEGRGAGTKGLELARDYLVEQLKAAGLQPGIFSSSNGTSSYLQAFRVFIGNDLGSATGFSSGSVTANSQEFVPYAFSRSGDIKNAELVFVGFGISLRNAGNAIYDDYEGIDVTGKIVVVFSGDPAIGSKESVFRNPSYYSYSTPMYKVQNAELHGAAGILILRDPLSTQDPEPALQFLNRQGGGASVTILAAQMRREFAERLLPSDKKFRDLQLAISTSQKPASFMLEKKANFTVELQREVGEVHNIAAFIPGTDPALAKEYIVIGAHYDHLGYGGDSSMDPNGAGKIHPGADDNASGVQGVFDTAVRVGKNPGRRSVLALFFSGEEIGLLGSRNFLETLPLPAGAKIVAMINLDMIGRLNHNKLTALALKSAVEFNPIVDSVNNSYNFELLKGDTGFGSSDHASFLFAKIPSLFFTTGAHEDYHRPSDTAEKINASGLQRIEDFVFDVWQRIDALSVAPTYDPSSEDSTQPTRPDHGYGSYFGSIPDFTDTPIPGVLLQGVRAGSPAERAGLQAKDILIGIGDITIKNLYDLVFALRYYRPNDEVTIRWVRGGLEMQAKTVLMAREGSK